MAISFNGKIFSSEFGWTMSMVYMSKCRFDESNFN